VWTFKSQAAVAIALTAIAASLVLPSVALADDTTVEGPVVVDFNVEVRPRRCIRFLIPDRGIARECPLGLMGGARTYLRPVRPLLIHARVQAGLRHIRNATLVYALTEPGEVEPPFPVNGGVVEAALGVGLWSARDVLEGMVWVGPSFRMDGLLEGTLARLRDVGLEQSIEGEAHLGASFGAQFIINAGEWVRIGGRGGLEALGTAAVVWGPNAPTSQSARAEAKKLQGTTELRTLGAIVAVVRPQGAIAFVVDLGFSTGWAFPTPAARARYAAAGVDVPEVFTLWPEARLLLGLRVRPGQ